MSARSLLADVLADHSPAIRRGRIIALRRRLSRQQLELLARTRWLR